MAGESAVTWRFIMQPDGISLSLAGYWYQFIGVPLLQCVMYRWLWRLVIWTLFLRDMSRLPRRLVPTHPDRAGGLGFLGGAHLSLAIFPFAFSCVLSAHVAFRSISRPCRYNGIVGLHFSCDGSHSMPWDEFLDKSLGFWLGTGETCVLDEGPEAGQASI